MADRLSLRDYQRELVERLREAGSGRIASKLGIQLGAESWLVDLGDTAEVIPVPPISSVPLTRPWFRGVANVRGNLYSVVDLPAFLGAAAVALTEQSRLVLLADRFRMAAALLVDRSLGLRNPEQLQPVAAQGGPAWHKGQYREADGRIWKELDVPELARHADFLAVTA
jgi:twitching motility protein PilI